MTRRILGSVVIFVSILFLPYWVYIPVLFIGAVLFPFFWEGILFAFLVNVLHGGEMKIFPSLVSPLALSLLVALILLLPVRENLRSYV